MTQTPADSAIALIGQSTDLERAAANRGLRLPRDLARARRRMRAAMLMAINPDASSMADRLHGDTLRLITSGRATEALEARRDAARMASAAYRPDVWSDDCAAALAELRAAVNRAEAITTPRTDAPQRPRKVSQNA